MFPPMLLYMRFGTAEKPGFGWWIPLFLVWLILLPLLVLALVVTILTDLVLWLAMKDYHHYTLLLVRSLGLLGATRGMTVRVHSDKTTVDIDIV